MDAKDIIGLDVGQKHTGIARASAIAKIAEPLKTVPTEQLISELNQILQSREVEAIVIGLPRNLDGMDTAQTQWVRQWVNANKPKIEAPLFWIDEALTSQVNAGHGAKTTDDHARAAATILQDFINSPPDQRVVC